MAAPDPGQGFLEWALEAYRTGVKAWSRDALLGVLLLLLAGVLIVAPFLRWSDERARVEEERARAQGARQMLNVALDELTVLTEAIAAAKAELAASADAHAAQLSERLRRFAALASSLDSDRGGAPGLPGPPSAGAFPGANIAQQFASPLVQQTISTLSLQNPADQLRAEYGLDDAAMHRLRQALFQDRDTPAWRSASQITEQVFRTEVERIYADLDAAVEDRLRKLRMVIDEGLRDLGPAAARFGLALPSAAEVAPKAAVVHLPPDDELFRTVQGKVEALRNVGLYEVRIDLDAAEAPLRSAAGVLERSSSELVEQQEGLERQRAEVERELSALDDRLKALGAEFGAVSGPLQWLAHDVAAFVRFYPTLIALASVWLVHRHARLQALRARLEADYRNLGMSVRAIRLALYVPDAALGGLEGGANRLLRLSRPAAVASFAIGLAALIFWIQSNPAIGGASNLVWQVPAVVLGFAACAMVLGRRPLDLP